MNNQNDSCRYFKHGGNDIETVDCDDKELYCKVSKQQYLGQRRTYQNREIEFGNHHFGSHRLKMSTASHAKSKTSGIMQ